MPTDASVCRTKGCALIPILGVLGSSASRGGKCDKHLDAKHPGRKVEATGDKFYRATSMILREIGSYSTGGKINIRGTADAECGSLTWNENGE